MKKNKLRLGSNPLDWIDSADPPVVSGSQNVKRPSSAPSRAKKQSHLLYYYPSWEKEDLTGAGSVDPFANNSHTYAVLDSDPSLFELLRDRLAEGQVLWIRPGNEFREINDMVFEIDIRHRDHYERLFSLLGRRHCLPTRVIHSRADEVGPFEGRDLDAGLHRGIYSLFHLTKTFISQAPGSGLELLFVHSSSNEGPLPQYEAVHAFARSIFRENPSFIYRSVQLSGVDAKDCAGSLLREFETYDGIDFEVRLERGQRFVKRLKEYVPTSSSPQPLPVKPDGVYLVTGGSGGLGIQFARYLVSRNKKATVVLTGRRAIDEEIEKTVETLKESGNAVFYEQSDISNKTNVNDLVALVKEKFGGMDGVFHCAGITSDSLMASKSFDHMKAALAPKVQGTVYLSEALRQDPLDFFVFCSSIAGTMGNEGQCDYSFANAFMDSFAYLMGRPFLSVGWSLWNDGGMDISSDDLKRLKKNIGILKMSAEDGLISLEHSFESSMSHCLAVNANAKKFKLFLEQKSIGKPAPCPPKSRRSLPPVDSPDSGKLGLMTENYLKRVISQETKIPLGKIDPLESFEAYGIDSIIVNQFNARMEKDFGKLSKTLLFECRTIKKLTDYFIQNFRLQLETFFNLDSLPTKDKKDEPVPQKTKKDPGIPWPLLKSMFLNKDSRRMEAGGHHGDVAVIGLGGRYPGAAGLEEFWGNLAEGRDSVTEIPVERWDPQAYYDADPKKAEEGKIYCKWGGFLQHVDLFDPLFFNISPKEAELMDPQERLFLECVWETFEDAGYSRKSLEGSAPEMFAAGGSVGVFVGVTSNSYQLLGPELWRKGNFAIPTSTGWSIANRISYFFNLKGPSMPVDTACSSALVAIHLACDSLARSECRMAVAGGVNLYLHPAKYLGMCSMNMLTKTGKCHTFGSGSDGFVPGEGVGAVLLKHLDDAVSDGDNIYAVIKGTAVNHGGRTNGFTVPDPNTQADLIVQALDNAGVDAESISYVEAHGTGTILGDPIEIEGLTKAFAKSTDKKVFCSIGSVKSNIGHLESAAGIAGLAKVVLQLKHRMLVPSLHTETLNPNINFEQSPFYVQRERSQWRGPDNYPLRAGLSSFGAGGTNAHIVVEEYVAAPKEHTNGTFLFVLSARTAEALNTYCARIADFIAPMVKRPDTSAASVSLANLVYTLQVGREEMEERLAIVAESLSHLYAKLSDYLNDGADSTEIYLGSTKLNRSITGILNGDEEVSQMIDRWIGKKEFVKIAKLWVQGVHIQWRSFYPHGSPGRVSLPTYPFSRQRYWILEEGKESCLGPKPLPAQSRLHPLVHENRSTFEGIRFSTSLQGNEYFTILFEPSQKRMINWFTCLEMVRAAGVLGGNANVVKMADVVWPIGIEVTDNPLDLRVNLFLERNSVHYEVSQALPGDSGHLFSHGIVMYENGIGYAGEKKIDIQAIQQRCSRLEIGSGNGMGVIRELYLRGFEGLASLESLDSSNGKSSEFVLHPALLEGVLQSLWRLIAADEPSSAAMFAPYHLRELDIVGPIPGECWVYMRGSGKQTMEFDLFIVDSGGDVRVKMTGLGLRPKGERSIDIEDLLTRLQAGEMTVDDALSFSEVRR